jgi:hypothetical protein
MVDGKQKPITCIGSRYSGDIYIKLADLLIKDCYGYPENYAGKLPGKLRKKFKLASLLSWLIYRKYKEEEIKVCGLYIIEYIEQLWAKSCKKHKKFGGIYKDYPW